MRSYTNLSSHLKPLTEGVDPPAGLINPDYVQQPTNPRKCFTCQKIHDCIVENTMTGERIEELKDCKDCIMGRCFK